MKKFGFIFLTSIVLISIGLWDYFTLRLAATTTKDEQIYQLIPAIFGATLLVISPLYKESKKSKLLLLLVILFAGLILLQLASFSIIKPYALLQYQVRHLVAIGFLLILLLTNIRLLRHFE